MTGDLIRAAAIVSALAGCNSTSSTTSAIGSGDADFISCEDEARAQPYQTPATSGGGTYAVKVLTSTFTDGSGKVLTERPAKGVNVWTVEVDSAATGASLDGLTIKVTPFMPDHRHGTTPVGVTPTGSGTYTLSPVNLYMAGYWEITFVVGDPESDGGVPDRAMIHICVPG